MQAPLEQRSLNHQTWFHQRWNHLNDPHVRTLAWLLDAPNLLDARAHEWRGRVATLTMDPATREWLAELDGAPQALHASLGLQPFTRLGRYAENLIAFYLEHRKLLFAHGLQVRNEKNETIGEFDFLLRDDVALVHWEFATKLYLLESSGNGHRADYFVGPNLADTLGSKVRKIMEQQLNLSLHPAAQRHLPFPVTAAQALVKGWLFYHGRTPISEMPPGISSAHCRGFWCAEKEIASLEAERYALLPRLSWLAPTKLAGQEGMDKAALAVTLSERFRERANPVLLALMREEGDGLLEIDRGFIVPDDWRQHAEARTRQID